MQSRNSRALETSPVLRSKLLASRLASSSHLPALTTAMMQFKCSMTKLTVMIASQCRVCTLRTLDSALFVLAPPLKRKRDTAFPKGSVAHNQSFHCLMMTTTLTRAPNLTSSLDQAMVKTVLRETLDFSLEATLRSLSIRKRR